MPVTVFASGSNKSNELTFADVIAGVASVEDVFGTIDAETVPEIIGYDFAVSKNHIKRLYNEEGNELNKLVFLNADGSKTAYIYDFPVKYINERNEIKDITLDIAQSSVKGQFETAASSSVTTFSKKITDGIELTGNNETVSLVPHLPVAPASEAMTTTAKISADSTAKQINKKTVSYIYDDKTTIEYSLTYTGFKEDIVVSEYTGQTEYEFTLYTNGLRLAEIDGSFFLLDETDAVKAVLGDIIIFTADEKNNTMGDMVSQTVVENQEYLLTIVVDSDFLSSEDTAYPIRIDPSVEICYDNNGAGAISDATINSASDSVAASNTLVVGLRQKYGIARVLMKFPGLDFSSLGDNVVITNASVEIRDVMCEAAELDISCYVFSGNEWDESTAKWSNVNHNSISTFLSSNVVSYSNGRNQTTLYRYSFDITKAVQGWKTGICNRNKGIIFKSPSSVENGTVYNYKTFASYNYTSYRPSLSVTYKNSTSHSITDDTYYFNNRYCGDYLRYYSSAATATSGLISSLGNSIRWEIRGVNGGYVIRSKSDATKYLGVPTNTENLSVSIITVSDSSIPERCIWSITPAVGGGCLVKNTYNSRYLYSFGDSVRTAPSTGENGSYVYDSRVWRIASTSYYGNTSSSSYREMQSTTCINAQYYHVSEQNQPTVRKTYSNELWVTPDNFDYSGYSTSLISINSSTGKITGCKEGTTTVQATHKVTNRTFTFTVTVEETYLYKTKNQPGLDENGETDRDMHCSDKSKSDLYSLNVNLGDLANRYDSPPASSTVLPPSRS